MKSTIPPLGMPSWAPYLFGTILPLTAIGFAWTGPHHWLGVLAWIIPHFSIVMLDIFGPRFQAQALDHRNRRPCKIILYTQGLLHLAATASIGVLASRLDFSSAAAVAEAFVNFIGIIWIGGTSAGISALLVAHELIHRRSRIDRLFGRFLLVTVFYEHFYTEHIRGHHVRVGTPEDPATARFGERFNSFFVRTVPNQFRSAWRLEKVRLGDGAMSNWDPRMIHHRCVHGLIAELVFFGGLGFTFGPVVLTALLLQALAAIRELEVVNYFEHWGLIRRERRINEQDSWDSDTVSSHYIMFGLDCHSDHHANESKVYQELCHRPKSPKLPYGYLAMVWMSEFRPRRCVELLTEELRRSRLGPFQEAQVDTKKPMWA